MRRLGTLIDHLRRLVVPAGAAAPPDAALRQRFLEGRDGLAFEVLLWRHGPMVLSACRRVLRAETARELGCPPGTVSYRLSWARQRLRVRLTRRGIVLPAGGF